jgi:hypothetical protein
MSTEKNQISRGNLIKSGAVITVDPALDGNDAGLFVSHGPGLGSDP